MKPAGRVKRGFVDIAEGQVHFREAGRGNAGVPLVMLHPSPGSARMLEPLIAAMAGTRHVVATDTLGNGDSTPPQGESPGIVYFADAHRRALDALGLERFDLYGSHTGANIACEIAIAQPDRVRRLILDGISLYGEDERADMLRHYAPGVTLDQNGTQFNWIWHFVRDGFLFWPWYRREAGRRRSVGLPSAEALHEKVVEVLKAATTYHLSYRAAIGYDKAPRLPLVRVPTLLACAEQDMFMEYFERVQALMPTARPVVTRGTGSPEAIAATASLFTTVLDQD
jgi:pimeloyl-ACP methyl ester carboxylesterase